MVLNSTTKKLITSVFNQLDFQKLGTIYCDEGGEAFWKNRRGPCQRLGKKIASQLLQRLMRKGRSLYIGAAVAELPMLITETVELQREVYAHNLRKDEVVLLNKACMHLPFTFQGTDAQGAQGPFDHIWIVSVLNDPEAYPETSALSYGRANPINFDPDAFKKERRILRRLVTSCLIKLALPGLITTSVEEIPWITEWCIEHGLHFHIENQTFSTAIVGDPLCFIHVSGNTHPDQKRQTTGGKS